MNLSLFLMRVPSGVTFSSVLMNLSDDIVKMVAIVLVTSFRLSFHFSIRVQINLLVS